MDNPKFLTAIQILIIGVFIALIILCCNNYISQSVFAIVLVPVVFAWGYMMYYAKYAQNEEEERSKRIDRQKSFALSGLIADILKTNQITNLNFQQILQNFPLYTYGYTPRGAFQTISLAQRIANSTRPENTLTNTRIVKLYFNYSQRKDICDRLYHLALQGGIIREEAWSRLAFIADGLALTNDDKNLLMAKYGKFWQRFNKEAQKFSASSDTSLYAILGIPDTATLSEIKAAYHKLALQYHPDKVKDEETKKIYAEKFIQITQAYKTLTQEN